MLFKYCVVLLFQHEDSIPLLVVVDRQGKTSHLSHFFLNIHEKWVNIVCITSQEGNHDTRNGAESSFLMFSILFSFFFFLKKNLIIFILLGLGGSNFNFKVGAPKTKRARLLETHAPQLNLNLHPGRQIILLSTDKTRPFQMTRIAIPSRR